jgi:hypothetical protein
LLIIGWVQIGFAGVFILFNVSSSLIAILRNVFKVLKMLCRRLKNRLMSKEDEVREQAEEIESGA